MSLISENTIKNYIKQNRISELSNFAHGLNDEERQSNVEVITDFCNKYCRKPIESKNHFFQQEQN